MGKDRLHRECTFGSAVRRSRGCIACFYLPLMPPCRGLFLCGEGNDPGSAETAGKDLIVCLYCLHKKRTGCFQPVLFWLAYVNIVIADITVPVAAFHHKAVVGHILVGILLRKSGVYVGIALDHRDVVGQALVLAQQVLDHIVLFAGLHDPVKAYRTFASLDRGLNVGASKRKFGSRVKLNAFSG